MNEIVAMVTMFSVASTVIGYVTGVVTASVLQGKRLDEILARIRHVENEVDVIRVNTGPIPGGLDL